MKVIYESKILRIGTEVADGLEENTFVLFGDNIPLDDLKDMFVCHLNSRSPRLNFRPGDILKIGEQEMPICWVGKYAMRTFKDMGHFTVRFYDKKTEEVPENLLEGFILVDFEGAPSLEAEMPIQVLRDNG